jgi:hypothetical protein
VTLLNHRMRAERWIRSPSRKAEYVRGRDAPVCLWGCVNLGGMRLAVPGSTGFVALAQRAVIKHVRASTRPTSPEREYADVRTFHRAPTGPEFAAGGLT